MTLAAVLQCRRRAVAACGQARIHVDSKAAPLRCSTQSTCGCVWELTLLCLLCLACCAVQVAREVELEDPVENIGAKLVRQVCCKASQWGQQQPAFICSHLCGDSCACLCGTTTVCSDSCACLCGTTTAGARELLTQGSNISACTLRLPHPLLRCPCPAPAARRPPPAPTTWLVTAPPPPPSCLPL